MGVILFAGLAVWPLQRLLRRPQHAVTRALPVLFVIHFCTIGILLHYVKGLPRGTTAGAMDVLEVFGAVLGAASVLVVLFAAVASAAERDRRRTSRRRPVPRTAST